MPQKIVAFVIPILTAIAAAFTGFSRLGDKPPSLQFLLVGAVVWVGVVLFVVFVPLPTTKTPASTIVGVDRGNHHPRPLGLLVLYAAGLACLSALSGFLLVSVLNYHHVRVSREARLGSRAMTLSAPHTPVHLELQLSVPPTAALEKFAIEPSPVIAGIKDKHSSDVTVILTDFHAPQSLSLTYRISDPALDFALLPTARPAGIRVFEEGETRRYKRWFWFQGGALWLIGLFTLVVRWRRPQV